MSNPQGELETQWLSAISSLLESNDRSELVSVKYPFAAVFVPGLSTSEIRVHVISCFLTLGLWVPVFAVIAILRTPKTYLIDASDTAGITTWELDV